MSGTSINNNFPKNYFFNDIKDIDPNLLSINKILHKNAGIIIHEIKYIIMQSINNQNIDREVPVCLSFSNVDMHTLLERVEINT